MKFFLAFTFTSLILRASALAVSDPNNALEVREPGENHLESRALPPCPKCPVNDGDWLSKVQRGDPGPLPDEQATYPSDWLPKAASTYGYTCYLLGPGVTFSHGGIDNKPYGSWGRRDGSRVMCWRYWQSTLQFVGPNLTVNSYPAHCTVWTMVRGTAARLSILNREALNREPGNGRQILPAGKRLDVCLGSATNIDVGVLHIWLG